MRKSRALQFLVTGAFFGRYDRLFNELVKIIFWIKLNVCPTDECVRQCDSDWINGKLSLSSVTRVSDIFSKSKEKYFKKSTNINYSAKKI